LAVVATKSALSLRLQLPVEMTLMVLRITHSGARGAFRRQNSKEIIAPPYQDMSFFLDSIFCPTFGLREFAISLSLNVKAVKNALSSRCPTRIERLEKELSIRKPFGRIPSGVPGCIQRDAVVTGAAFLKSAVRIAVQITNLNALDFSSFVMKSRPTLFVRPVSDARREISALERLGNRIDSAAAHGAMCEGFVNRRFSGPIAIAALVPI
jgi:hypothetical protein